MDICGCDASVKVNGLDYYCAKRRAGLIGSTAYGVLTDEQRAFVGIFPPRPRNGWRSADDWVAKLDPDPEVDLERTALLHWLATLGGMTEKPAV